MRLRDCLFLTAAVVISLCFLKVSAQDTDGQKPELLFFHSYSCHACSVVKNEVMPDIEKMFSGKINIRLLDIADVENYKLLVDLKRQYGFQDDMASPVMFLNGRFLAGEPAIRKSLVSFIEESLADKKIQAHDATAVDMVQRFLSFSLAAIIGAGLIDGINPCAFTVIVFFVSFLTLQGYTKKKLAVIGGFYILAVFITYFFIGLGLFNFLYRLENFWLVRKIFNWVVGIISVELGVLALYDFLKFRATGSTEDMALQLPHAVKNRIHAIIGLYYRRSPSQQSARATGVGKIIASALITGFLVSVLESICTGQVYLPTITLVLKTSHIKMQAFWYLLLYNLMFIIPLCAVFLFALWGTTSQQFGQFFKKHVLMVKILMMCLFFTLGGFLIWRA